MDMIDSKQKKRTRLNKHSPDILFGAIPFSSRGILDELIIGKFKIVLLLIKFVYTEIEFSKNE